MYKSILAILLIGLLASPTLAEGPFQGWGLDCDVWQYSDPNAYFSEFALSDGPPQGPCDVRGWTVFWGPDPTNVQFKAFGSLELFVELYAVMTCFNTHWEFHMIADEGRTLIFEVCGLVASNSELTVQIGGLNGHMGYIRFIHDKFDNQGQGGIAVDYEMASGMGHNIPDEKRYVDATQYVMELGYIPFFFEPCDHWWCIRGRICIEYHQDDGYYLLQLVACPWPVI